MLKPLERTPHNIVLIFKICPTFAQLVLNERWVNVETVNAGLNVPTSLNQRTLRLVVTLAPLFRDKHHLRSFLL